MEAVNTCCCVCMPWTGLPCTSGNANMMMLLEQAWE